jgi:hypothetical protein
MPDALPCYLRIDRPGAPLHAETLQVLDRFKSSFMLSPEFIHELQGVANTTQACRSGLFPLTGCEAPPHSNSEKSPSKGETRSGRKMISRGILRSCLVASVLSVWPVLASDTPTLSAGSISEGSIQKFSVGGSDVSVYEGAGTPLANASILTAPTGEYYYLVPLTLTKVGGRAAHVIKIGPKHYLSFTLCMPKVDTTALQDGLRQRGKLGARADRINPLAYRSLEIGLAPFINDRFIQESGGLRGLNEPTQVVWELSEDLAADVAKALNDGTLVPTAHATLVVSLKQQNHTEVKWSRITGSKLFQDYAGPSGPSYVTAAQVAELAADMMDDLKVLEWREFDEKSADLTFLMERLRAPTPIEVDISSKEWSDRLGLDVKDFTKLVDVTTQMATDAKNLNDEQWCQKYESYEKLMNQHASTKNDKTKVVYKVFDGRHSRARTENSTSESENKLNTSDCGRDTVASQFKYDWIGTKYVPKSVYLYQNLSASAATKQTAGNDSFRITRKLEQLPLTVQSVTP